MRNRLLGSIALAAALALGSSGAWADNMSNARAAMKKGDDNVADGRRSRQTAREGGQADVVIASIGTRPCPCVGTYILQGHGGVPSD